MYGDDSYLLAEPAVLNLYADYLVIDWFVNHWSFECLGKGRLRVMDVMIAKLLFEVLWAVEWWLVVVDGEYLLVLVEMRGCRWVWLLSMSDNWLHVLNLYFIDCHLVHMK